MFWGLGGHWGLGRRLGLRVDRCVYIVLIVEEEELHQLQANNHQSIKVKVLTSHTRAQGERPHPRTTTDHRPQREAHTLRHT